MSLEILLIERFPSLVALRRTFMISSVTAFCKIGFVSFHSFMIPFRYRKAYSKSVDGVLLKISHSWSHSMPSTFDSHFCDFSLFIIITETYSPSRFSDSSFVSLITPLSSSSISQSVILLFGSKLGFFSCIFGPITLAFKLAPVSSSSLTVCSIFTSSPESSISKPVSWTWLSPA